MLSLTVLLISFPRMRESLREKLRMRWKRLDPEYREKEREKDRIRRSKSRENNTELRQRERERDKISKRYKYVSTKLINHINIDKIYNSLVGTLT